MTTIHLDNTTGRHPGRATPRCAALLSHGRLQLAWDPASGHHRLGITQAAQRPTGEVDMTS